MEGRQSGAARNGPGALRLTSLATARSVRRAVRLPRFRPLGLREVVLGEGCELGDWQRRNSARTLPHCVEQVRTSGAVRNFERVRLRAATQRRCTKACPSRTPTSTRSRRPPPGIASRALRWGAGVRRGGQRPDRARSARRWLPQLMGPGPTPRSGLEGLALGPRALLRRPFAPSRVGRPADR